MAKAGKVFKWFFVIVVLLVVGLVVANYAMNRMSGPPVDPMNISDMRSLNTALHTYHSKFGHYPDALQQLGVAPSGPASEQGAGLIGSKLASGMAHGYRYIYSKTPQGYEIHGEPGSQDSNVHLYTDETLEVRFQQKKRADRDSAVAP